MPNPLFGNKVSPNGATAPTDPLYDTPKKYARGYNKFNLTRQLYNTERYADITPIEALEGVEGDRLPFGNKHEIRSYTFKSPKMFDIYKKKTYFMVDNKAILPINWEKVYKQPNKGDDVAVGVNCVSSLVTRCSSFLVSSNFSSLTFSSDHMNKLLRFWLFFESVFSNGSLLASLGCHLSPLIHGVSQRNDNKVSFDTLFDETFSLMPSSEFKFSIPELGTFLYEDDDTNDVGSSTIRVRSIRQVLDLLREHPDFTFIGGSGNQSFYQALVDAFSSLVIAYDSDKLLNLSRLVAYQLVCTQFYTRDSVDNIYNADLFMQNAKDIAINHFTNIRATSWPTFLYNGSRVDYDVFSGTVIDEVLLGFLSTSRTLDLTKTLYYYLHLLFFYRKSLRYGDYFTAAKTLPYAPGDVTADVVSNGVSALDMTRSILMQRFLNSVERARNTWKDYLKDVTDGVAPPNPLEPRFLASSTSMVGGFEVENTTSQNQGNIVTILKSGNSNYVYEVEVGSPCIIIGVSTYEIPRVYSRTIERFFYHEDRFDMFNKFMQNIGDQEIFLSERNGSFSPDAIFGYQPRYMEYKKRYPVASGGFVENLPGYAFITDNMQSGQLDDDFAVAGQKISSFYIRNKNSEMDRFYGSLTGLSLASYFHFICRYDCICHAQRKMEYSPSIL